MNKIIKGEIILYIYRNLNFSLSSTPPRNTHLSRILIALLVHGGVPEEFFMQILNKALEDAHGVFCKTRAALKGGDLIVLRS